MSDLQWLVFDLVSPMLWLATLAIPAHPPVGTEFEYEPGRYITVVFKGNGWTAWKRANNSGTECVAAKPADGLPPLTFNARGWVRGGLKVYLWRGEEGEKWGIGDSTDAPLIVAEWRERGERFMRPFPVARLFPVEGHTLRSINGPSPFVDGQLIEVHLQSRIGGRSTTGRFSLIGLDATREALRRCRNGG